MNFLISGATGLIGARLCRQLAGAGHSVKIFSRSAEKGRRLGFETVVWQPEAEVPPPTALEDVDIVIHLAGEHIATGRWTDEHKRRIRDSRVLSTRNLVTALRSSSPKPKTFICASAIGFYGDRNDEILTEQSIAGTGFLSEVCQQWEAEAEAATTLGCRVLKIRIGVVLANEGSALQSMLPVFRLGLGGNLGAGRQWFPWVHVDDVVGIIHHAIVTPALVGPVNATAPGIVTNADFTSTLAEVLQRPAFFNVPAFALRLAVGEMADLLLMSSRVSPEAALASGYHFRYPLLRPALENVLLIS